MIEEKREEKFILDVNITTYISDDDIRYDISREQMEKNIKYYIQKVLSEHDNNKELCINRDNEYNFFSYEPSTIGKIYDENNPETYKHFVYKYLQEYYKSYRVQGTSYRLPHNDTIVYDRYDDSYDHSLVSKYYHYNPIIKLHERMMSKEYDHHKHLPEGSVKEIILMHLISCNFDNETYRTVTNIESSDKLKEFLKFILDSKMFDTNEQYIMPPQFNISHCGHLESYSKHFSSIAELLIILCWKVGDIELIYWLEDNYGLDLEKASKFHKGDISYMANIIKNIHDRRIHDFYNNVPLALHENNKNYKWRQKKLDNFVKLVKHFTYKYPELKFIQEKTERHDYVCYDSVSSWLKGSLLYEYFNGNDVSKKKSAKELLTLIKADVVDKSGEILFTITRKDDKCFESIIKNISPTSTLHELEYQSVEIGLNEILTKLYDSLPETSQKGIATNEYRDSYKFLKVISYSDGDINNYSVRLENKVKEFIKKMDGDIELKYEFTDGDTILDSIFMIK